MQDVRHNDASVNPSSHNCAKPSFGSVVVDSDRVFCISIPPHVGRKRKRTYYTKESHALLSFFFTSVSKSNGGLTTLQDSGFSCHADLCLPASHLRLNLKLAFFADQKIRPQVSQRKSQQPRDFAAESSNLGPRFPAPASQEGHGPHGIMTGPFARAPDDEVRYLHSSCHLLPPPWRVRWKSLWHKPFWGAWLAGTCRDVQVTRGLPSEDEGVRRCVREYIEAWLGPDQLCNRWRAIWETLQYSMSAVDGQLLTSALCCSKNTDSSRSSTTPRTRLPRRCLIDSMQ